MPRDLSIKKTLVIGSGPIVIGQAAEFDYSGTQAVKAFKEDGVEVVLVNSNPATIMTDRDLADATYIEPITIEMIEKIIAKERPDSLIAGMGGQTGLNISCELYDLGILDKYNVKVIGTSVPSIKEGEDREGFKNLMERIGEPIVESGIVNTVDDGAKLAETIGYPVIIRPAYTLGGSGGGIADNETELREILAVGLQLSRVNQALIEKSIKGWKEIEFEVIRDNAGNCIAVCSMENVDPVGVHTGDSIVVAPAQTLSAKELTMLKNAAIKIIDSIEIKGGCNVQFGLNPVSYEYAVIEINPRVSRSSALASKATGYPIAKVASKIALGYNLDEIINPITGTTYACSEPSVDYCVIKIPKWPFDKFYEAKKTLGSKMMATGEVMAIGTTFEHALLKGVRSLEIGQYSLERESSKSRSLEELKKRVQMPDDERLFDLAEMLRRNYKVEKVSEITGMDPFFIQKLKNIVDLEEEVKTFVYTDLTKDYMLKLKKFGFSDKAIGKFTKCSPQDIYQLRKHWNMFPSYKRVDTCAGEFDAVTPYYYSAYDESDETDVSTGKKVLVLGSGPIRIGQGIEFDYCSVHSVMALKKMGIETIIINNNPETVSTDFGTADKLYFEPLTEEDVLDIVTKERPDGVILQFGGQTAIKLANFIEEMDIPVYGTKPKQMDAAEDREKFEAIMEKLNIARPEGKGVWNVDEGIETARKIGYPVLVRPSYVLGGRGMEITRNEEDLVKYLTQAFKNDKDNPVLIDIYLNGREIEVDAVCDGEDILIPGIMEHLERAGVHSGDSISIFPPQNLSESIKQNIITVTRQLASALEVIGMINIQFIEYKDKLYVIEVNPRSSRTVPYISKVTAVPVIEIATRVMLGEKLKDLGYTSGIVKESETIAVKVPVFSTEKLPMAEVSLGPEMRSTGEVLGVGKTLEEAFFKGFVGAKMKPLEKGSAVLASIKKSDQEEFIELAKRLYKMDCKLYVTEGTGKSLAEAGITDFTVVKKIGEGVPNVLDIIRSGVIDLIINIPEKSRDYNTDGFRIRRTALESSITLLTSLDTAGAMVSVMESGESSLDAKITKLGDIK